MRGSLLLSLVVSLPGLAAAQESPEERALRTFTQEVDNQLVSARSLVTSARARRADRDPQGALVDLAEAKRVLDDVFLLTRDFQGQVPAPAMETHLGKRAPELQELRRDLALETARAHLDRGDRAALDAAAAALRPAVAREPGCAALWLELGRVHALRDDLADARAALERVPEADPAHAEARLELARVLDAAGEHDAALACLAAALQRAPGASGTLRLRAELLFARGRFDEALRDLDAALAADDGDVEAFLWRGRARQALGRLDEAFEDLTEAIDLDPSRPDGYQRRGELEAARGRREAALHDFEVALHRAGPTPAAGAVLHARARAQLAWAGPAGGGDLVRAARDDLWNALLAVPGDAPRRRLREAVGWAELLVEVCARLQDDQDAARARARVDALRASLAR